MLLYFLLLLYYLLFRFLVNMQYFRNITSPDSYFFFEVNNQFFIEINVSMKSLKSGLSCERIIFVVFFYQKYIFCFQFFGSTLEKKWIKLRNLIKLKSSINKLLLCTVSCSSKYVRKDKSFQWQWKRFLNRL